MNKKRNAMGTAIRRTVFAAEMMALGIIGYAAYKFATVTNWDIFWLVLLYG